MADMVIEREADGETIEITFDEDTGNYEAVQIDGDGNVDTKTEFGDGHTWLDLARIYANDGDRVSLHDVDYGPFDKETGSGVPDVSAVDEANRLEP